jgi:hypothetical protein
MQGNDLKRIFSKEVESAMSEHGDEGSGSTAGFALIMAILALLLLTFLGLTLATTTSTELQIATNYRWGRQAYYNAEAGLEAGKFILRFIPNNWFTVLPNPRGAAWAVATTPALPTPVAAKPDAQGNPSRNFETAGCDTRAGEGFGSVLDDTNSGGLLGGAIPAGPYQNVTTYLGQAVNGSFTLWVRRGLTPAAPGTLQDDTSDNSLVLTSEGVAPFRSESAGLAISQINRATAVLQLALNRSVNPANPCQAERGQVGGSPSGANFGACAQLKGGAGGSLQAAFGGAGAGDLADTGVR